MFLGLWPQCVDRTSCAAVVTALLQLCACFDLSRPSFVEQIFLFCSHRGRLCGLTRWKMLSGGEGSYFSPHLVWKGFSVVKGNLFSLWISALGIAHFYVAMVLFHLSGFCCHIEDDTAAALAGAVSHEGKSPNSPSVNPIVLSPMR